MAEMNSRDRVLTALDCQQPDRVPTIELLFNEPSIVRIDDLLEEGFDGIHPIQPQCMDIGEVKAHLAGRACVVGNIDCRNLLPFGTEDEVVQTVRETIEKAGAGGGYILSSSNSIHPGCKPENYIAMVRATQKYGVYPTK